VLCYQYEILSANALLLAYILVVFFSFFVLCVHLCNCIISFKLKRQLALIGILASLALLSLNTCVILCVFLGRINTAVVISQSC